MKANHLAVLVLRLIAIYCFVEAIPMLGLFGGIATRLRQSGVEVAGIVAGSLMPAIGLMVAGALLLLFSRPLGALLAEPCSDEAVTSVSMEDVQTLAFAVAGILIFVLSLPQLVGGFFYVGRWLSARDDYGRGDWPEYLSVAGTFMKAVLALALFFRARGFAKFWRFLRTVATPKPAPDPG